MNSISKMNLKEKIEFLRENPVFWSRLGYELERGGWEAHVMHAKRHKALYEKGIKIHSSIIPSGWIGPEQYDYTDTDRYLDLLFSTCPDVIFLPRVKLNVPEGWCEAHPDDVFVYGCGPRSAEDIRAMIGTPAHGSHPFKETDMIAQQSFFSQQWIDDACETLRRFIEHVEASPWADRILGYHLAYGTSGETTQWGTWNPDPFHKGDYGINATKAFIEYAAQRGKDYQCVPPIEARFHIEEGGTPQKFHIGTPTLDQLFFHKPEDEAAVVYSHFVRDGDIEALDTFCKVAKGMVPHKLIGGFYGYITEPTSCANMQHTGYERLLNSPYIDFVASPKGYTRVGPTDPGFGHAVPNSVSRKKIFMDELDNRTHLCKAILRPEHDYPAKNFDQTRAVYWREFTRNIVYHQGYWWMDLYGGWLDTEEIRNEVMLLNETSKQLFLEKETHKSVARVLLLVNEEVMHRMRPNFELHRDTIHHTGSTFKESGVPVDYFRVADLKDLDLSQYKMIVFMNDFYEDPAEVQELLKKAAPDCHIIWNYAAGIMGKKNGGFGPKEVQNLTGFSIGEYPYGALPEHSEPSYPILYIEEEEGITPLAYYSDGRIKLAKRQGADGRTHILSAMPGDLTPETAQSLLKEAGIHLYTAPYCTVHTDNRFIYVLSQKKQQVQINLPEPTTCRNVFTGEVFENAETITLDMEEGTCVFLKYVR